MFEFIVENYYVILIICILLIFAIIGYIVDTLKRQQYQENNKNIDSYIPEEEIFIQKTEDVAENEVPEESVEELLEEYNQDNTTQK